jgi:predicted phosphatase
MIAGLLNLQSFNDGSTKKVSVYALEDASGGLETLLFQVLDQSTSVQVQFAPNQGQVVTVTHTASGQGAVSVMAANSSLRIFRILNVDKQPGDSGTGADETTLYRW